MSKVNEPSVAPESAIGTHDAVDSASKALEASLQADVVQGQIPGAIVMLSEARQQRLSLVVGYQDVEQNIPLRPDSIFRLYSMSKPITSVAVMMLVEDGKLALDDAASQVLPEFANMRVYVSGTVDDMETEPVAREITIADLLSHTAGIIYPFTGETPVHDYYRRHGVMRDTPVGRRPTDGAPAPTLEALVARIGQAPLFVQPGAAFNYSYATTVLGLIIERVSGQPLETFLRTRLFDPLGMTDTGFYVDDEDLDRFVTNYAAAATGIAPVERAETSEYRDRKRLVDGGGALAGTASDYLRFAQMLADGGVAEGRRLLKEETVDLMFAPHADMPAMGPIPSRFGYGFQIGNPALEAAGQLPDGAVSWAGSGNTFFWIDRRRRVALVFMTQVLTPPEFLERALAVRRPVNAAAAAIL